MTVKPGSINMGRILRHMAQRTNQSRKVTFYRAPLYTTDDYGVEGGVEAEAEIQLPGLPALIRPALTADYRRQRSGQNIIGAGRVYTANLSTIKGMPNFNQDNNENFNEIEGWDKFIDISRDIYQIPTSTTTGWTPEDGSLSSDGQSLTLNGGVDGDRNLDYSGSVSNILEADRLTFKITTSGTNDLTLKSIRYWTSSGSNYMVDNDYRANYSMLADFLTPPIYKNSKWLTVDMPVYPIADVVSKGTSVYSSGTRYPVTVTAGDKFTNTQKFTKFQFTFGSGTTFSIKDIDLGIKYDPYTGNYQTIIILKIIFRYFRYGFLCCS